MSNSCLKLFYYLPLYLDKPEIFNLIHNNPPFQPHPLIWPLCLLLQPHIMPLFARSLCSILYSLTGGGEENRTGRPVFKPTCILGKEVMA